MSIGAPPVNVVNGWENVDLLASTLLTTTSATTVYTVLTGKHAAFSWGALCNTSGSAVTVSVALVPAGGSDDGTHTIISSYSLAGHDTLPLKDYLAGAGLKTGGLVSVTASAANALVVSLGGAEN